MENSCYLKFIIENIPRVLTQIDRDKDSRTYGSCDRNYWHLKIRDFSSAILQQTSLTLAMLYKYDFAGNIYYKNPIIKEWAVAALKYMGKIQLRDGSFNEYYPNEHGFPPTAFILYAGCMTYKELELDDEEILKFLGKTARWLGKRIEKKAYNQEFASIVGLYLYYTISEKEEFKAYAEDKLTKILGKQSKDGYFMEQGGADIGYLSVSLDMLTEYYLYSADERVVEPINKVVDFFSYFIHQDGTIGGEYGSRNTIYFMPNGIENVINMNLPCVDTAIAIREKIYFYVNNNHFMDSVDERYLTHYVMHSYLRANKKYKNAKTEYILPCDKAHKKIFEDAGLVSFNNGNYHAIIATKKGGLIKTYSGGVEKWLDCGYRTKIKEGTIAATNWLDQSYIISYGEDRISIKGKFNVVTPKVQNPIYHLGLRVGAAILGDKVNKVIKKLTIFSDSHNDMEFERSIILDNNSVILEDEIRAHKIIDLYEADNNSLRLVASGKFFSKSDLLQTGTNTYSQIRSVSIKKEFNFDNGKLSTVSN